MRAKISPLPKKLKSDKWEITLSDKPAQSNIRVNGRQLKLIRAASVVVDPASAYMPVLKLEVYLDNYSFNVIKDSDTITELLSPKAKK